LYASITNIHEITITNNLIYHLPSTSSSSKQNEKYLHLQDAEHKCLHVFNQGYQKN